MRKRPPCWRTAYQTPPRPNARTRTVAALIEKFLTDTKRLPTDAELAVLLAISPTRVRRHRNMLRM